MIPIPRERPANLRILKFASVALVTIAAACSQKTEVAAPAGLDEEPLLLSTTGLFSDTAAKTLSPDAMPYEPTYKLWSDGADKKRWIRLPAGTTIDTTDADHWRLPVGAQLFKEFSKDGKRIETRLIQHRADTGDDAVDYWMGSFLWRADESDADFVKDGAVNARGTALDVPSAGACWSCHVGEGGRALGFSALQLTHATNGLTLADLRSRGMLSADVADVTLPGNDATRAAIGYLHANCGHCHNEHGSAWTDTDMVLRWSSAEKDLPSSDFYRSTVGAKVFRFRADQVGASGNVLLRIAPGKPDESAIFFRITKRGDSAAMPPLATKAVDDAGAAAVRSWIASLAP